MGKKKLEVCTHPVAPLLAATVQTLVDHKAYKKQNPSLLRFPFLGSPKLDGLRCLTIHDGAYTREMNRFPNHYVQSFLSKSGYQGLDGELIVGEPIGEMVYRRSHSGVMSEDKEPDFTFWVFDIHDYGTINSTPFQTRLARLKIFDGLPRVKIVPHKLINNMAELEDFELECIEAGYEGVMLRSLDGVYRSSLKKENRSTFDEHSLMKLKRFEQDEAQIIGFKERMENRNVATQSALGHTERSSDAAGKVGRGDLGSLIVRNRAGKEFPVGTGIDDPLRKLIWDNRPEWLGEWITYKFFAYGSYDLPRHPVFKGKRAIEDMGV